MMRCSAASQCMMLVTCDAQNDKKRQTNEGPTQDLTLPIQSNGTFWNRSNLDRWYRLVQFEIGSICTKLKAIRTKRTSRLGQITGMTLGPKPQYVDRVQQGRTYMVYAELGSDQDVCNVMLITIFLIMLYRSVKPQRARKQAKNGCVCHSARSY
jgi:hypothetical protein